MKSGIHFFRRSADRLVAMGLVGIVLVLSGCTMFEGPEVTSPAEPSESFSDTGTVTPPDRWWTSFDDPALNDLVERSLEGNVSLRQSWNRLAEARAVVRGEESGLFPSVDVTGQYQAQSSDAPGGSDSSRSGQLGLSAQYELDLWGRIESSVEAAEYESRATRQDLRASAVSLTAEVSRSWFQLVEQYAQRSVLQEQLETNQQVLELVETRFQLGRVRAPDVLRQRRLVDSTRQQISSVESTIQVLEHQLAVLLGRIPDERVNPVRTDLPSIPPIPETGVPSQVINRRPDVRAAFLRIRSANREVATAIADRYPRFTISGSITTEEGDRLNLFDNWMESIAADFALPLFDAGQRKAEVSQSKAVLARQINAYRDSVLVAYREIEDALAEERQQQRQIELLNDQLENATQTMERLRSQYVNGTVPYLDVLEALESQQQLRRDLVTAREQLLEDRIALYRALAGGFEMSNPIEDSVYPEDLTEPQDDA